MASSWHPPVTATAGMLTISLRLASSRCVNSASLSMNAFSWLAGASCAHRAVRCASSSFIMAAYSRSVRVCRGGEGGVRAFIMAAHSRSVRVSTGREGGCQSLEEHARSGGGLAGGGGTKTG